MPNDEHGTNGVTPIAGILWLVNLVYTFTVWGLGWAIVNIFLPVSGAIDIIKHLLTL